MSAFEVQFSRLEPVAPPWPPANGWQEGSEPSAHRNCVQPGRQVFDLRRGLSPIAAALLVVCLSLEPATAQPSAANSGTWESLDAGDIPLGSEPLRQLFDESELVVLGIAGTSFMPAGAQGEVATELRLNLVLKGREAQAIIRVFHSEQEDVGADRFAPGALVLAFLNSRADGAKASRTYETDDATFGLKELTEAEMPVYRERIESLAALPRYPQIHPDDLAEWLVATAEEPVTRKAAAGEILAALDSLRETARQRGTPLEQAATDLRSIVARGIAAGQGLESEPSPALVAAFLSDEQRDRLSRVLRKSATLDRADLTLYEIVKSWDRPTALAWFARQLRDVDPAATEAAPADLGVQIMDALARELGNRNLQGLVKGAQDQLIRLYSNPASFGSASALRLRQSQEAEIGTKLLGDYRQALAAAQ
ncbi:MAG: hypothetical protein ABJC13_20580 [Acidobacteriota bacterium]